MSILEALILGIIQGITEFLPVSSSGHLQLFQALFGLEHLDRYILFDLVCHLGTLLAIMIVFFRSIVDVVNKERFRLVQILIALIPLFPLVMLMKPIKALFEQPMYLGYGFLVTAFLLYQGVRRGYVAGTIPLRKGRWWQPFVIGIAQAIAVIPGISRSGSTVSVGRMLGWKAEDALRFSFLLAVPTMIGGALYEALFTDYQILPQMTWVHYAVGFCASFVVGIASLNLFIRMVRHNQMMVFVWYCCIIGFFCLYKFRPM
ncbi:MAG: undecaprenyl-diphosphate phosphatase [Chlamydiales bacterium]|nr:undecaprenyl-diphosphate phosphatase [Chlamydiales bacterium]